MDSTGNSFVDKEGSTAPLSLISGAVIEDVNDDGMVDTPLQDVLISLLLDGEVGKTTVTDENGRYEVSDLDAGDYIVMETNLPSYEDVSDTDLLNDNLIFVDLGPDDLSRSNNFVDRLVGSRPSAMPSDPENPASGAGPSEPSPSDNSSSPVNAPSKPSPSMPNASPLAPPTLNDAIPSFDPAAPSTPSGSIPVAPTDPDAPISPLFPSKPSPAR